MLMTKRWTVTQTMTLKGTLKQKFLLVAESFLKVVKSKLTFHRSLFRKYQVRT